MRGLYGEHVLVVVALCQLAMSPFRSTLQSHHLQAVPLLASTIGMLLGFIFISGLTAVQLYSDAFHFACISDVTGELEPWESDDQGFTWGCGGSRSCPANLTCADLPGSSSISEDVVGFDNVGAAMLTAFQVSLFAHCYTVYPQCVLLTYTESCAVGQERTSSGGLLYRSVQRRDGAGSSTGHQTTQTP